MGRKDTKTLFFDSLPASITVEAPMVLPLFLFCMIASLQYCRTMETAVQFGAALTETGESLALDAYLTTFVSDAPEAAEALARLGTKGIGQAGSWDSGMHWKICAGTCSRRSIFCFLQILSMSCRPAAALGTGEI